MSDYAYEKYRERKKKKGYLYTYCCGIICIVFAIITFIAGSFWNFIIYLILAIVCITIGVKGTNAMKPIPCPQCHTLNQKKNRTCFKCGMNLKNLSNKIPKKPEIRYVKCTECGTQYKVQQESCHICGRPSDAID